jgi:energy-coupling factor transporter ATP-binding protein EcfA2
VVDRRTPRRDWAAIGVSVVLPDGFAAPELLVALRSFAVPVTTGEASLEDDILSRASAEGPRGSIIAVCGPGGTGVSTLAMALAQGLHGTGPVLLADLARRAQQALLHDAGDVIPGVQELAETHRVGSLAPDEVVSLAFDVPQRGYHLLLGLRRPRAWSTLRPRAFEAGLDSLRRAYGVVVCDTDADFEGESDGGSLDVEERNLMARTVVSRAAVVLAVGLPGLKGLHSLVQVLNELSTFGVPAGRLLPVVNRAPRSPRARAELKRTLIELVALGQRDEMAGPLFLPERAIEETIRDGSRLPGALVDPLASAVGVFLERASSSEVPGVEARLVRPGSLGRWAEEPIDAS